MSWECFKRGQRCPKHKELSYEYVKKYIESFDYKLLSLEYKGCNKNLIIKCNEDHIYKVSWSQFNQGSRCPECNRISKCFNIKDLKKQTLIIAKGYKLVSNKYINSKLNLKFKCNKGHNFKMTWNSFSQGQRCVKCYHESGRKNYTDEELENIKNYKTLIRRLSNKNYIKYKKLINPKKLKRSKHKYHLDHIYSMMDGFRNSVQPEVISNPNNLQILWCIDNINKSDNSNQTKKKLYLGYYKYNLEEIT